MLGPVPAYDPDPVRGFEVLRNSPTSPSWRLLLLTDFTFYSSSNLAGCNTAALFNAYFRHINGAEE
jgi:hypothetical protein